MAISVVQRNLIGNAAATTTAAVAFLSNVTAGNAIIAIGTTNGADSTMSGVTDSQGNTYNLVSSPSTTDYVFKVWVATGISTGANTVTLTTGFNDANLFIFEVHSTGGGPFFDQYAIQKQSSSTALSSGNTPTLSNSVSNLLIGVTANTPTTGLAPTVGTGYSNLQTLTTSFNGGGTEEQVVASNTPVAATFGLASNTGNEATAVFVFSDTPIIVPPTVITNPAITINPTTVTAHGNVTSDGAGTITERGFVYGTALFPTTANTKVTVAGTTGAYSSSISTLTNLTPYHLRAYAINSAGTSYGTDILIMPHQPGDKLLLEDGTSGLLLEDSSDYLAIDEPIQLDSPLNAGTTTDTTPDLTFVGYNNISTVLADSYNGSLDSSFNLSSTSASDYQGVGQIVKGDGNTIKSVSVYLKKAGTATGNAFAKVYAVTGTVGTNAHPTGTALATSDAINVGNLTTTLALTNINFSNGIELTRGVYYAVTIEYSNTANPNWLNVGCDTTSPTDDGNFTGLIGTSWSDNRSNVAMVYFLYTTAPLEYELQIDTVNTFNSQPGGSSFSLGSATLNLNKIGTPADNLSLELRATVSGVALATSNPVAGSTISTSQSNITFTFSTPYTLAGNTKYYLVLSRSGAADINNFFQWWYKFSTNPYSGGGVLTNPSGTWGSESTTDDFAFNLFDTTSTSQISQSLTSNALAVGDTGTLQLAQSFTTAVVPNLPLLDRTSDLNPGFYDVNGGFSTSDSLLLEDGISKLLLEDGTSHLLIDYSYGAGDYVTYTVQSALANGTYYWRVRSKPVGGSYSAWSDIRSFTIGGGATTYTRTFTTDILKRKATVKTHTTDALLRKVTTRTHTTDSLLRAKFTRTHTTDSLLRKQVTKAFTTDILKRAVNTRAHTTNSLLRAIVTKTQTTDSFLKHRYTRTHTTDSLLRKITTRNHTTDSLIRKINTRTHTTDSYLSTTATVGPLSPGTVVDDTSIGSTVWTNPTNAMASDNAYATAALGTSGNQSDYLKATNFGFSIPAGSTINGIKVEIERKNSSITDNSIKIVKGGTIGGTEKSAGAAWSAADTYDTFGSATDLWGLTWTYNDINSSTFGVALSAKEAGGFQTASVDHIRISVTYTPGIPSNVRTHTTDSLLRAQKTRSHTTDALKHTLGVKTHTTDSILRAARTRAHTTDALLRKVNTRTHTTDSVKRAVNTRTFTTNSLLRATRTAFHTTNSLLHRLVTKTHNTDSLLRKANTRVHTTNSLLRAQVTKTFTTSSVLRRQVTVTHTTNSVLFKSNLRTHTTDSLKRATITRTHTTDSLKHLSFSKTHTADSTLRASRTVSHTTNALKRLKTTRTWLTDALLRRTNTRTHTTDSLLKQQKVRFHTSDSLLRKQVIRAHTTDSLKRKQTLRTHTTDSQLLKGGLKQHTTDSLLRKTVIRSHTTDSFKLLRVTKAHTTSTVLRKTVVKTHTTDTLKRAIKLVSHTTDLLSRRVRTVFFTTDSLKKKQFTRSHTTDSRLSSTRVRHTTDTFISHAVLPPGSIIITPGFEGRVDPIGNFSPGPANPSGNLEGRIRPAGSLNPGAIDETGSFRTP